MNQCCQRLLQLARQLRNNRCYPEQGTTWGNSTQSRERGRKGHHPGCMLLQQMCISWVRWIFMCHPNSAVCPLGTLTAFPAMVWCTAGPRAPPEQHGDTGSGLSVAILPALLKLQDICQNICSGRFYKSEHQFHSTPCFWHQVFWGEHPAHRICELYLPPTWNHHAGTDTQGSTNDACCPRTRCVLHSPPSHPGVQNTEHSKANRRALGHPKYPFPGNKEPGVLPPDVYEHSVALILFPPWYKDPTTHPTDVPPSKLYCAFTSESAAHPHCSLLGAEGQLGAKPFLPSPALGGGRPCSLCDYRAQEDSVKGLALERCSDFTQPAQQRQSFLTNLPPSPRVSRQLGLLEQGLLIC